MKTLFKASLVAFLFLFSCSNEQVSKDTLRKKSKEQTNTSSNKMNSEEEKTQIEQAVVNVETTDNNIPVAETGEQWLIASDGNVVDVIRKNVPASEYVADVMIVSGEIMFREDIKSNEEGALQFTFPDDFVLGEEMEALQEYGETIKAKIKVRIDDKLVFESDEELSTKRKN